MRRFNLVASLLLIGTAACTGGLSGTPMGDDDGVTPPAPDAAPVGPLTARQMFDQDVQPILSANCASCHAGPDASNSPDWMSTDTTTSYNMIVARTDFVNNSPANSMLLQKGAHTGPAFTDTQVPVMESWLAKEAEERNLQPPPTPPPNQLPTTFTEALTRFGDCMSIDDWNATGMNDLQNQNTNQGRCKNCHNTGTGGAFLGADPTQNFEMNRNSPYLLKLVLGTVNQDGSFKDVVAANRFRDKGQENSAHPNFTLTDARLQALNNFYSLTYQKYLAGGCPPRQ